VNVQTASGSGRPVAWRASITGAVKAGSPRTPGRTRTVKVEGRRGAGSRNGRKPCAPPSSPPDFISTPAPIGRWLRRSAPASTGRELNAFGSAEHALAQERINDAAMLCCSRRAGSRPVLCYDDELRARAPRDEVAAHVASSRTGSRPTRVAQLEDRRRSSRPGSTARPHGEPIRTLPGGRNSLIYRRSGVRGASVEGARARLDHRLPRRRHRHRALGARAAVRCTRSGTTTGSS
jgi:hypothetical protein